jgi:hypothetical protein
MEPMPDNTLGAERPSPRPYAMWPTLTAPRQTWTPGLALEFMVAP